MKEYLKRIITRLPISWITVALVGVISGLIFGFNIGIYTFMGIVALITLFVFLRQIYWLITKTGDFKGL